MSQVRERTFIMIKPDGVNRGLISKIIKRFEQKGFKLVALKMIVASEELLREHHKHLVNQSFFPGLIRYMHTGPVVPMVWEGVGVVKAGRDILGKTNSAESAPGTIRGDYSIAFSKNVVHGSDAVDTANREIKMWFDEKELVKWDLTNDVWTYEV